MTSAMAVPTPDPSADRSVLARIRWMSSYMNPALRRIAKRVLEAPDNIKSISIRDLAVQCAVSESTVTRFVREIDVSSFQQFKILIAEELSQNRSSLTQGDFASHVYEDISQEDTAGSIIQKVAARYAITAEDTRNGLNVAELERAVEAIEAARTLAFFALGSSIICVENALMRFMRVGKACQFFLDAAMREFSVAALDKDTLAIGISNSGRTITTVNALKNAKEVGARTLCITSFPDSPIVRYADLRLFTPTVTGARGFADYHESMVSKIAQLQVIDVLYSCYAVRNFGAAVEGLERTAEVTSSTRF